MRHIQVKIETKCFPQAELVGTLGYDMIRGNAASPITNWSVFFVN